MIVPIDVCTVVHASEPLLQTFIQSNTTLRIELPTSPAAVRADAIELEQIFLNTILNANEAIQAKGIIVVSIQNQDDRVQIGNTRQWSWYTQRDSRMGFEPFHTTKPEGSGLGLATVNRIVQDYNGTLQLDTGIEGGTCVRITLPRIDERLLPPSNTPIEKENHHTYNILLIDDDPRVGWTIQLMLEKLGHQVEYLTDSVGSRSYRQWPSI